MIKNTQYLTLVLFLFFSDLSAQTHKCGVTVPMGAMIMEQMMINRNEMRDYVQVRNSTVYLPVRFFLVAKNDGSDRPDESKALDALCRLNNNYADQEIQFYLKEIKYVNNTTMNENPGDAFSSFKGFMLGNYNAINVFIVKQIGDPVQTGGITLAYYQPPASGVDRNDWLVSAENYADDFEVMTHELGHYFSLEHTFYGWEIATWNNNVPTPNSNFYAGQNVQVERADGSNCATAADRICDTPADYLHNFDPGCSYKDNALDPTGAPIDPDPNNFMTYNNSSCIPDLYFTDGQKEEIQNSLNSTSRNYIPKNYTPANLNQISSSPTIISPQNLQTVPTYNHVELEWTAIADADNYLLEVIHSTDGKKNYIVDNNKVVLTDLLPQSNYFWKVRGFSEYATCGGFSGQKIFKTGSSLVNDTNEILGLSKWSLAPNPIQSGDLLKINIESEKGLALDIQVSTVIGQTVQFYSDQKFANGISTFEINTTNFPAGIYLVSLKTADGVMTKRVSVL